MDELQNDPREFSRFYAVNAKWIERWLAYMDQEKDMSGRTPPGPIDNQTIADQLTQMSKSTPDEEKPAEKANYYNISKPLFLFFQSMYGGGPVIVANGKFRQVELGEEKNKEKNSESNRER